MHLRGDIYWWHGGEGRNNHVGIYIGNGKMIDCTGPHLKKYSVKVRDVPKTASHERKIIHFDRFPISPESYFDTKTQTIVYKGKETETKAEAEKKREYNNVQLDGDPNSIIDPRFKFDNEGNIIPMDNVGNSDREYRAIQSACYAYDGKNEYVVCAQNKNYGSIKESSKGGRIVWSDMNTGKIVATLEVDKEGGHMDGVAYDSYRNMVLKPSSSKEGNLLQIDNNTKNYASTRYTKMSDYCNKLTYVSTIHQLVGLKDGKFIFMSYDESKNEYVKQREVKLEDYHTKCGAQGIGTDGENIFIADSEPKKEDNPEDYRIWTYSLDGKKLEEHKIGSGYDESKKEEGRIATSKGVRSEVESAFADNDGNLWLVCPDGLIKAKNYKASLPMINYDLKDTVNDPKNENTTETNNSIQTMNFTQDETLMTIDSANIVCAGKSSEKSSAHGDMTMIGSDGHYLLIDTSEKYLRNSVIKFLNDKNYADKEFDILISHNHEDHWGNAEYLMNNYKVGTLYLPEGKEAKYEQLERVAKSKGINVIRLKKDDTFNIGKAKLEVLYNPNNKKTYSDDESNTNNKSLVTRISVQTVNGKEIRYLTCGDIQEGLEKELLEEGIDVKADIFKLSHHGMFTSNKEEFLDAVQPKYTTSNWWQDNSEQFPRTESTPQVRNAGKYGTVYSVIYNDGVKFSISAHGVITPEIHQNVENVPYVIKDSQGNAISVFNLQVPRDAKVGNYKDPKKELNFEQIQAIQSQVMDYKIVGEMITNTNTANTSIAQESGPIKVLFVGNSFTYYNDCAGIFAELAKKQNREVIAVCATRAVWGADELLGLKKDEKGDKIATYYWDNRGNETKLNLNGKKALDYNTNFDSIISTDWGNLGRANSWDYVVLQNHSSAKENNHVYDKMKNMIGNNPGNLIVLRTWGERSSDNMIKNADENGYSWINVNDLAKNKFDGNWKEELSQQDDRLHPSSEGAYLTAVATYATIFGKEELAQNKETTNFIPLYNQDGQKLENVIKESVQHKSNTKDANDVTMQEAKEIQALVYQNFETNIKSRVVASNMTNTKQIQNIPDGAIVITVDGNYSNIAYTDQQKADLVKSKTGENMVNPRPIDIPNVLERIVEQALEPINGKEYSMVIPMPNTQGIICDEYGSYEDPNQLYTLNSEKMYPAYYAVNLKFDAAEKNCRVIKDEIVDENGNLKEIYALVNNDSLLKTVRPALVIRNTKITDRNGTVYDVQAGRRIIIVGNTAIVSEITLNVKDIAGTIPSSDLIIYNDIWKEVFTGATKDIHIYYDNKTKQNVWGYKSGRKKMTIYSPENIKLEKDNKKCVGTEVKEQTPGELEARFTLIGKLGEKDNNNQNEIEERKIEYER